MHLGWFSYSQYTVASLESVYENLQGYRSNGKEIGESIRTGLRLRSLW